MTEPPSTTPRSTAAGFDEIPVISLATRAGTATERAVLAATLCEVAHTTGFFVAVDHGIPDGVVGDVFDHMEAFFALPDEAKATIDKRASPWFRGWEAVGSELTNNRVDVREQIDVWSAWPSDATPDDPIHHRLHGPNQWLDAAILPDQQRIVERWMAELGGLADDLLALFAIGLGLDERHFVDWFGDRPMSLTKLIHYPATPEGAAGVNAHHDTGFVTVLAPGPVAGLQVQNPAGRWIDVPQVDGGFVVNLGEMLQALTGNFFVATPHRVIAPRERLSAAYFHGPSLDARLDPLDLDPSFATRVAASPRHASAGFMASTEETASGVADMSSRDHAATYGDQLWRYFARSYPDNMRRHHPDVVDGDHGDRMPAAVLIDMDGTLVDTEPYWIESEHELVAEYGGTWTEADSHSVVGFDLLDAAEALRTRGGVRLDRADIVEWLLDRVIERCRTDLPWRPGARELLMECREIGLPVVLVTMSWRRFADAVLDAAPTGTFVGSITGDEVTRGKPAPDPYLAACHLLDVNPADCIAIEDSPTGVESAWRAGCRTICVPHVVPFDPPDGVVRLDTLAGRTLADLVDLTA